MQSQNRLFDDFVKVVNGAAGTLAGMAREAQSAVQDRTREWAGGLDLVTREEFEAVKAMAAAARDENEDLKRRIETLEAAAGVAATGPSAGKTRRKPGTKGADA